MFCNFGIFWRGGGPLFSVLSMSCRVFVIRVTFWSNVAIFVNILSNLKNFDEKWRTFLRNMANILANNGDILAKSDDTFAKNDNMLAKRCEHLANMFAKTRKHFATNDKQFDEQ